jgi:hypothetical protein
MDFPRSRSEAAFLLSYRRLASYFESLYFWTFTAAELATDEQFAVAWWHFHKRLVKRFGGCVCGLRVFERHMGHGQRHRRLHCHCVISHRLEIRELKELAAGTGIGQVMWVRKAWPGMEGYLGKYLRKCFWTGGKIRRWAKFGPWEAVKVGDMELHSASADLFRELYAARKGEPGAYRSARADFNALTVGKRLSERPAILENYRKNGWPTGVRSWEYAALKECVPGLNSFGEPNPF